MIKHALKDKLIHLSIDNVDFSYRIPVKKIGNTVDWRIGEKGTEGIVMKDVSTWALQLYTKNVSYDKYLAQFKEIVQEYAEKNKINWEVTMTAIAIQNEYNALIKANVTAEEKMSEVEIISNLKKKYKLS